MTTLVDVKAAREEAEKELREERLKRAKDRIKSKLREITNTEQILANQRRELADIEATIAEGESEG